MAADSAYDKEAVYEAIEAHSPGRRTRVVIPQRNATLSQNSNTAMRERDRHIRAIERHGRREWYKLSSWTERSMVENAVYRYKAIMGPEMRARTLARFTMEASQPRRTRASTCRRQRRSVRAAGCRVPGPVAARPSVLARGAHRGRGTAAGHSRTRRTSAVTLQDVVDREVHRR